MTKKYAIITVSNKKNINLIHIKKYELVKSLI